MPQVSVIVPVFNVENYVGRCINSILSQTYRDLELILVDDGSTDRSLEICRNWAALDSRVRVIAQKNAGVSEARNRGLSEARGEYVQFADSDDYIAPDMTERLLSAMQFYGQDSAICSLLQMIEKPDGSLQRVLLGLHQKESERVFDRDALWKNMLSLVWHTSAMEGPCNKLYTRKIIEENGLRFPCDVSLGEDFLFNMEYYKRCRGLVFVAKPLYFYRIIEKSESLTCRARPDFLQTMCLVENALYSSVEEHHRLTREERQIFADHFSARLCAGFSHLSLKCGEEMAKQQIAKVIQREDVQKAFEKMGGAFPQYAAIPGYVKQYDVGQIVAECVRIARPQAVDPAAVPAAPAPMPGVANRILTKTMRGLQKIPVKPLQKWARIVELNLMTVGMKTTFSRIFRKVAHR